MLSTPEQTDINVLGGDMSINHPGDHNLQRQFPVDKILSSYTVHTVGIAIPYATFAINGLAEPSAGDATC
jgi:hypothetical protein